MARVYHFLKENQEAWIDGYNFVTKFWGRYKKCSGVGSHSVYFSDNKVRFDLSFCLWYNEKTQKEGENEENWKNDGVIIGDIAVLRV